MDEYIKPAIPKPPSKMGSAASCTVVVDTPGVDSTLGVDSTPGVDSTLKVDSTPAVDSTLVVDCAPVVDSKPVVDSIPTVVDCRVVGCNKVVVPTTPVGTVLLNTVLPIPDVVAVVGWTDESSKMLNMNGFGFV